MVAVYENVPAGIRRIGVFWPVLSLSALIVGLSLLMLGRRDTLVSEWAGPELASTVTLAVLALWLTRAIMPESRLWPLPATVAFLCLRELDFQNWFFDPGLVRAELLTGPAPLWQKAICLAVMVVILATLVGLARVAIGPLWRAVRQRAGWALVVVASLALLAIVTQLDGLGGDLARAGYAVSSAMRTALLVAEEAGELVFALGLALAADLGLRSRA